MNPENETAGRYPGAQRKIESAANKPQSASGFKRDFEDRRNAAACFKNPNRNADWQPEFVGVTVAEGLEDGAKVWVNVHQRTSSRGETYFTVVLKPWRRPEH
jgi:hypothetical protein